MREKGQKKKLQFSDKTWTPSQDRKIFFSVKGNLIGIGKQITVILAVVVAHEGTQKLQKQLWRGLVSLSFGVCVCNV